MGIETPLKWKTITTRAKKTIAAEEEIEVENDECSMNDRYIQTIDYDLRYGPRTKIYTPRSQNLGITIIDT